MRKLHVLLVDDEADFLDIMGTIIKGWGYDLLKARSGKEAIEAVKTKKPDMVILDYMMPEMDGIAALKAMRKVDSEVPVIMFTAYPEIKAMEWMDELKVSAFIPKLSTYTDVSSSLRAAIEMIVKKMRKTE